MQRGKVSWEYFIDYARRGNNYRGGNASTSEHKRARNMTVQEWLKQDRQWTRQCRIAHAEMKLKQASTPQDVQFWTAVLVANRGV